MTDKTKREMKNAQKTALLEALVAAYGEGAVVTRKQLMDVWAKNKAKYAHIVTVRKNADYKVGRNLFVVTTSETPAVVRDKVLAERKDKQLPEDLKNNPVAIAKIIRDGLSKAEKKKPAAKKSLPVKATKAQQKREAMLAADHNGLDIDFDSQGDDGQDIADIMRVMAD